MLSAENMRMKKMVSELQAQLLGKPSVRGQSAALLGMRQLVGGGWPQGMQHVTGAVLQSSPVHAWRLCSCGHAHAHLTVVLVTDATPSHPFRAQRLAPPQPIAALRCERRPWMLRTRRRRRPPRPTA